MQVLKSRKQNESAKINIQEKIQSYLIDLYDNKEMC